MLERPDDGLTRRARPGVPRAYASAPGRRRIARAGAELPVSLAGAIERPRAFLRAFWRLRPADPAGGPLRARGADRHHADGDPAMRAHLCLHGASLAARHEPAVDGADAGRRGDHRSAQNLSRRATRGHAHRAGPAQDRRRFSAARAAAAGVAEAVLLDRRRGALERDRRADQPALLARHGRRSNLIEIRILLDEFDPARRRLPQRRLRLEFLYLHALDGRHVFRPDRRRGDVPAQPDQADPVARRRGGGIRQGARRPISGRAARARCARRASPSSR